MKFMHKKVKYKQIRLEDFEDPGVGETPYCRGANTNVQVDTGCSVRLMIFF